jgi:hypothetical protein
MRYLVELSPHDIPVDGFTGEQSLKIFKIIYYDDLEKKPLFLEKDLPSYLIPETQYSLGPKKDGANDISISTKPTQTP